MNPQIPCQPIKFKSCPNMKACALCDKLNVAQTPNFSFIEEKTLEKGENAICIYQHFCLFLQCFQEAFSIGASKVVIVLVSVW